MQPNTEITSVATPTKRAYQKPVVVVYGKVEKLTLQTGAEIPGGGGTGPGGSTVIP